MKNNITNIIIGVLLAIWIFGEYVEHTRSNSINLLIVAIVLLLSYRLVSGSPRIYRRRGLRG
jgi:hypothetical protein